MKLGLATYATPELAQHAVGLVASARTAGFSEGRAWGPVDFAKTPFMQRNRDVLSESRGGGYWLWKPWVILESLEAFRDCDAVLYCDAGRSDYYWLSHFPDALVQHLHDRKLDYLLGPSTPHHGPLERWTKRDCFIVMGAEGEAIRKRPPLVGAWSVWRRTRSAVGFLEQWLKFCEDRRCLTDQENVLGLPNYSNFVDHRHDQSILSILAYQMNAPYLDFSDTWVQRLIALRPHAAVSHMFYKRPSNANDLLKGDNPFLLFREHMRIKRGGGYARAGR